MLFATLDIVWSTFLKLRWYIGASSTRDSIAGGLVIFGRGLPGGLPAAQVGVSLPQIALPALEPYRDCERSMWTESLSTRSESLLEVSTFAAPEPASITLVALDFLTLDFVGLQSCIP
jgi:hypothetical protein